jgi:hypothetical protein
VLQLVAEHTLQLLEHAVQAAPLNLKPVPQAVHADDEVQLVHPFEQD